MLQYIVNNIKVTFANQQEVINQIDNLITHTKTSHQIVTLNLLIYLQTKFDPEVYNAVKNSSLVIPDSVGISVLSILLAGKFYKQIPGVELISELCKLANRKKYKIFLLGGGQTVVETTAQVLKKKYSVNIVGYHHGYFDFMTEQSTEIVKKINVTEPDILFVGLSNQIQEKWIYKNLNKLNTKVVIGTGGSFDVISGSLHRAPRIFQILGMEWYFRLLQQPCRITRIMKLPLAVMVLLIDIIKSYKK